MNLASIGYFGELGWAVRTCLRMYRDIWFIPYRGTSLIRNTPPVGPCLGSYGGPMGGGGFLQVRYPCVSPEVEIWGLRVLNFVPEG